MKFIYKVKWRAFNDYKKPEAKWKTDLRENYHFVKPGTYEDFPDHHTELEIIKLEAIVFKVYPLVKFDIADITKAIAYTAEEGMTEETAELIHAAKTLGLTKEPETIRL